MVTINEETKKFIKENKDFLSPVSVFNLVKNYINFLVLSDIKVTNIHKLLEKELEIKINIKSLYAYIKKLKRQKTSSSLPHDTKNNTSKNTLQNDFLGVV